MAILAATPVRIPARLALLIAIVLWGLITHGTFAGTGDDPHYKIITHSLTFDGDLDVADDYAETPNLVFGERLQPESHAVTGIGGRLRPVHDIGMPLLFVPYYALAHATAGTMARIAPGWLARFRLDGPLLLRHLISLAMIGVTVWLALQMFAAFTEVSASPRAFGWTALIALSPPVLSHAYLFMTEVVSAALAFWAYRQIRRTRLTVWQGALAGGATGYLVLIHARNIGLVAGLVAIAALEWWPQRRSTLRIFATAVAALVAIRSAVNHAFWGTWIVSPHARPDAPDTPLAVTTEVLTRLGGWLFDQEHGLLLYAPIYLLVPYGFWRLVRTDRRTGAYLAIVIVAYVGVMAMPFVNVHGWRGGWSPAARFLVPIVPMLALGLFHGVAAAPRLPRVAWALVLVQLGINAVSWQDPKLLWNDGLGTSALLAFLGGGTARLAQWFPTFLPPLTPATLCGTLAIVLAAGLVTAAMASALSGPAGGSRDRAPDRRDRSPASE